MWRLLAVVASVGFVPTFTSSTVSTSQPRRWWLSMLSQDDKRLTPEECQREAMRYAGQAYTEPQIGMRTALLNVARSWQALAEQIERLEVVRQINTPP